MSGGRGKGQRGKSSAVKDNRNETGTFYDIKVCLFATENDPVLEGEIDKAEVKGVIVEGNT